MPTFIRTGTYLTKKEAAERCGVIPQAVQRWITDGKLPAVKVEDLGYLIEAADLEQYKRRRKND